jgi:PBP1b-binding outer membrane lipoprotein LpoB
MRRYALVVALAALIASGCANTHNFNTVVSLGPVIADEIKVVSDAVEGQKAGLQSADCTTDPKQPTNCYVAFSVYLGKAAEYDDALAAAIRAVNTTSAKVAVANLSDLVSTWIQTRLIKLPAKIQPYILVALSTLRGTLIVVSNNLGG